MTGDEVAFAADGAWCWFQDPRAVRHVGARDRTYAGWITSAGDVAVGAFDHDSGEVSRTTLHANFERDDHDAPALYVDRDGHLVTFYTAHGGPEIHSRRSRSPEDVSAFGPQHSIAPSDGHTYPNPRRIRDRLFLFYRNGAGSLAAVVSDDEGETWTDERELVTTGGRDWCVYFQLGEVHDDGIDAALTFAEGGTHHPHRDVRHVRFDGDVLRTVGGTRLGRGITFDEAPVVYDSEAGHDAWVWDCAVHKGAPSIAYAELRAPDDHAYRYARWTGDGWIDERVCDAGSHIVGESEETYYSGGIALDGERPGVCYPSVGDHDGSALERAERGADGTWELTRLVEADPQHVRPVVPRDRDDELRVLLMRGTYEHYTGDYRTEIVGIDGRGGERCP